MEKRTSSKALTSKQIAIKAAGFADDKKAQDVIILDMRKLVNFCDYFVIATGTSDRHAIAIGDGVDDGLSELGVGVVVGKNIKGFGGQQEFGAWVLLDMGDVVFHAFEPNAREFYGLEHLWQDAPKVPFKASTKKK